MANKITYSRYTFNDSTIYTGTVAMANAMMFDTLQPDELTVEVQSESTGIKKLLTVGNEWVHTSDNRGYVMYTGDIREFTYGDPVFYYQNNVLVGKFYIRSIERLGVDRFKLSACSAVGLWTNIQHYGGVYNGTNDDPPSTAGNVIADILSGYTSTGGTYTIASDVAEVPIYGYLPIASVRDNLQQVLFAVGASLMKDRDGNPQIKFLQNVSTVSIPDNRIFQGGSFTYKTPATAVQVTEHTYYKSDYDQEVSLFDNRSGSGYADSLLVTFDNPSYLLSTTGTLAIESFNENHAILTGTGTLTGKEYSHSTKTFSVPTGQNGETRLVEVKDATLVNALNSANVAARVSDHEGAGEEVAVGIVLASDNVKPGSLVAFNDPFGDATRGFISDMTVTMSAHSKADCTVIKGYTPGHFGNNYTNCTRITSNRTWYVPSGVTRVRIVLIGAGQAGQAGTNGGDAYASGGMQLETYPGEGGAKGVAGVPGKVYVTDIDNPTTISFSIGTAGQASGSEGAYGGYGGNTTATMGGTQYTSANGDRPDDGFTEIFTGDRFATNGIDGVDGANGGDLNDGGEPAGNVTFGSEIWFGGIQGENYYDDEGRYRRSVGGGMGGGAAYGSNGEDGEDGAWSGGRPAGGRGGNGANASIIAYTPPRGGGGAGGCGGGGGGCPGYYFYENDSGDHEGFMDVGVGGSFSKGTNGGAGIAFVYY